MEANEQPLDRAFGAELREEMADVIFTEPAAADQFIICAGSPIDGLTFWGPFGEYDQAEEWAIHHAGDDWWITEMEKPEAAGDEMEPRWECACGTTNIPAYLKACDSCGRARLGGPIDVPEGGLQIDSEDYQIDAGQPGEEW